MKAPVNAALLLGALAALASGFDTRADLLPDAVEVPVFTQGAVSGRRYETRKVKPAVQLDARLALTRNVSLTAHVVADEKLCKKQPEGLHVTSCAVWLGVKGNW
jgi:hypothetical protein